MVTKFEKFNSKKKHFKAVASRNLAISFLNKCELNSLLPAKIVVTDEHFELMLTVDVNKAQWSHFTCVS